MRPPTAKHALYHGATSVSGVSLAPLKLAPAHETLVSDGGHDDSPD
jgi:hypothetical protein